MIDEIIGKVMKELLEQNGSIENLIKKVKQDKGFQEFLKNKRNSMKKDDDCNCNVCKVSDTIIKVIEEKSEKLTTNRERALIIETIQNFDEEAFLNSKIAKEENRSILKKAIKYYIADCIANNVIDEYREDK